MASAYPSRQTLDGLSTSEAIGKVGADLPIHFRFHFKVRFGSCPTLSHVRIGCANLVSDSPT